MVIADEAAKALMELAYPCRFSPNAMTLVAGRHVVAFDDLSMLMKSAEGKQIAWHALKQLVYHP